MGKSKDGNVTCFMYTQMRIVGLGDGAAVALIGLAPLGLARLARWAVAGLARLARWAVARR